MQHCPCLSLPCPWKEHWSRMPERHMCILKPQVPREHCVIHTRVTLSLTHTAKVYYHTQLSLYVPCRKRIFRQTTSVKVSLELHGHMVMKQK